MRTLFVITSIVLFLFSNCTNAQDKNAKPGAAKEKLSVYYFHATNRCPTCISIEDNTKKVLETYFKKEVDAGTIKLYVMSCDDEKNKALVDKYGAYGSTLVLQGNTGKAVKDDVTNFAFQYSKNNPDKFKSGLKEKIEKLIK